MVNQFIAFIPTLVAIILLIIVGKIVGTFLGKLGAKILDKIGLDDLIDKTVIGGMIRKGQMSTVGFFDAVIRWFVYIIFAMIILDLLNIEAVNNFVSLIVFYIPLVISAFIVLLIGLLIVDFISDLVKKLLVTTGIDEKFEQTAFGASVRSGGMTASGDHSRTDQTIRIPDLSHGCVRYFTADHGYAAADKYYPVSATPFHRHPDPDDRNPFYRYSNGLPERYCQRHECRRGRNYSSSPEGLPASHSDPGCPGYYAD